MIKLRNAGLWAQINVPVMLKSNSGIPIRKKPRSLARQNILLAVIELPYEILVMNKALILKIGKIVLKVGVTTLKFSTKFTLNTFLRYSQRKENFSKWQRDYDEFAKAVARKEPLC